MKKVLCRGCGELKKHCAHELCEKCYYRKWSKENPEKVREHRKRWYIENREKQSVYSKKWNREHKEERREHKKQYEKENSDKIKEYKRKYRVEHREKEKERNKKYYAEHRDKRKECMRKWRRENLEKVKESTLKRRINGTIKKGIISKLINENIFKYGVITCEACKKECETKYHVDHIKPVSKGGMNDYDNLQILCAKCNLEKHAQEIKYIQDSRKKQLFLREVN